MRNVFGINGIDGLVWTSHHAISHDAKRGVQPVCKCNDIVVISSWFLTLWSIDPIVLCMHPRSGSIFLHGATNSSSVTFPVTLTPLPIELLPFWSLSRTDIKTQQSFSYHTFGAVALYCQSQNAAQGIFRQVQPVVQLLVSWQFRSSELFYRIFHSVH